ncbi:hypothetical protein [Pseudomonas sp. RIT-PI-AD]|uniref:hypothetical protein n=1 Tax=Pseudomonas sp. RIT-PI-AD TaxID=3035294 RepID=UPI0021D9D1C1|nr:hypothetical protein [Pseudomonas sp. RIT-PI-AD]
MLVFKRNTREGQTVPGQVTLVVGNNLIVKLVGLGPDKKHYAIKSDSPCVDVQQKADDRFLEQTIRFKANMVCQGARITVYEKTSGDRMPLELKINVLEPLMLPPENTDEGLLARLLLAECIQPISINYPGEEENLQTMQYMRLTIENRVAFQNYRIFGNPASRTVVGIVTAGGQFKGFGLYPKLDELQARNISDAVRYSNDGSNLKFSVYRKHVQQALDVAYGRAPKIAGRVYGWRTAGSEPAGGSFVPAAKIGGQQFNTLRDEVLNANGVK